MEISSSTSVSQQILASLVSVSVQKIAMDQTEQNADAICQMMEQSVTPHLGGNIDFKG